MNAEAEAEVVELAEVRNTDTPKGKCLFATTHIPKGTVIFEEDPLVCCQFYWNEIYKYSACDYCLRPLETVEENVFRLTRSDVYAFLPFPEYCTTNKSNHVICPNCNVWYCSEDCLNEAYEKYHKTICLDSGIKPVYHPLVHLEKAWKKMHYPPETTTIFLIVKLLAMIVQAENEEEIIETILNFCHKSTNEIEKLAHKFLGEKFARRLRSLRRLVSAAFPQEIVQPFLTPEGFEILIALLGTNGQGVATSPFSAWQRNLERFDLPAKDKKEVDKIIEEVYNKMEQHVGLEFVDNEGVALYVKQSKANHSCDPNAEVKFLHNNFRLSLVALKDIKPDEEICISYLDECQLNRSRHSRKKFLMENYLFVCVCPKCLAQCDEPDVTSSEDEEEEVEEMSTGNDN